MIETSSAGKEPPLLSPRTADYIAALVREGEDFDYSKWLQRVRGKEASTKCIPSKLVDPEMDNQAGASACNSTWPNSLLLTRAAPIPKTLRPPHRASKCQTAENAFGDGLKSSDMRGTYFRPAGHAMPSTDIWKPCSLLSNISKYGEKRRNFCGMRLNLLICLSTGMRIRLLP